MNYDLTPEVITDSRILTNPNIPKPLHGLAPRVILGKDWWDITREATYARNNYHCFACGIYKKKAKYFPYLEAHEIYHIDYKKCRVELKEVAALCHSCHAFIHSGRMYSMYEKGEYDKRKYEDIIKHGLLILNRDKLKPFYLTLFNYCLFKGMDEESAMKYAKKDGWIPETTNEEDNWNKWHMVVNKKKYYSKFESINDWREFYNA